MASASPACCQNCRREFSQHRGVIPKLLNCSCAVPRCAECIAASSASAGRPSCACPQCGNETSFPDPAVGAASLLTNYHLLPLQNEQQQQQRNAATAPAAALPPAAAAAAAQRVLCVGPGCEAPAFGICIACSEQSGEDVPLCDYCFTQHIHTLPLKVRPKHTLAAVGSPGASNGGSKSNSPSTSPARSAATSMCARHDLPRQLYCLDHCLALCPTCAASGHRDCDVRELSASTQHILPRLVHREARLRALYSTALGASHAVVESIAELDRTTGEDVARVFAAAEAMLRSSYESVLEMHAAALTRRAQLLSSLRSLGDEAGTFAEHANVVKSLTDKSDPFLLALYAPAGDDEVKTLVPSGAVLEPIGFAGAISLDRHCFPETRFPLRSSTIPTGVYNIGQHSKIERVDGKIVLRAGSSQGVRDDEFNFSSAELITLPTGDIVVSDGHNNRLQFLDARSGRFLVPPLSLFISTAAAISSTHGGDGRPPIPATPGPLCVLRNGLIFVLSPPHRAACFVDVEHNNYGGSSQARPTQILPRKNRGAAWPFPARWSNDITGVTVLPCGCVAVLDRGRSCVSVLNKDLDAVVREFDGVECTVIGEASIAAFVTESDFVKEKTRALRKAEMTRRAARGEVDLSDDGTRTLEGAGARHQQQQPQQQQATATTTTVETIDGRVELVSKYCVFRSSVDDFLHRVTQPLAISDAFILRRAHVPLAEMFPTAHDDTSHIYPPPPPAANVPADGRALVAVCSTSVVALLDPYTGAHVRFVGGDASAGTSRPYNKPTGVCVARDGERLVIASASAFVVARTRDGSVLSLVNVAPLLRNPGGESGSRSGTISAGRAVTLAATKAAYPAKVVSTTAGQIVFTDAVSHTLDFLNFTV